MLIIAKSTFYSLLAIFVFAIVYSCAQVGSISGGDKDTLVPVMIYSEPQLADTGFTGNRIKITFDEYFVLNDINQEFIASPPFKEFPKIKTKKHSIIIDIADTLIKPETYTLYFGNAIADLNEGNVLENFSFIFSTGNKVDSFAVSGRLKNAQDLIVPENIIVSAYREQKDSIPFLKTPDYLSRIDTSGNFSISNIQEGTYKIFAFQDLNGNLMLDPMEKRAFIDSVIIPQREIIVNIDSLKAGTILHDINDTTYADTLLRDTVIITEKHYTYPNNIYLYLFPEIKKKQRVAGYLREKRGKINFTFDIPISDKYKMQALNFNLNDSNYLTEINPEKDSILYWIKDSTVQNIDTLKFALSYASIDSLNNPIMQTDTIDVEFREKKENDAWKKEKNKDTNTVKTIEYLDFSFNLKQKKLDLQQNLDFEVSEPLLSVDSSKIKLFEIIDTNTVDTKKQKILRAIRISEKEIFIQFRRPIVNKLKFSLLNENKENQFRKVAQADSSSYYFEITDEKLAATDTLNITVDYDNNFFLEQIQDLRDTIKLAVEAQRLIGKKRKTDNRIELAFHKPIRNKFELSFIGYPDKENGYKMMQNTLKDSLIIKITDNELRLLDTLKLFIKSIDYINLKGKPVDYTDTITMVYHPKLQYLSSYERLKPEKFSIVFNKTLFGTLQLEPLNFTSENWYSEKRNSTNDTLSFLITDKLLAKKDSLNIIVKFSDKDRHNISTEYADTINLIKKQKITLKEKEQKVEEKSIVKPQIVHIYYPIEYKLWQDSSMLRMYHISSTWKTNTNYRLRLDSMAFTGYLNHYNQFLQKDFATHKEEDYALLNISIQHITPDFSVPAKDTTATDSLPADSIEHIKAPLAYTQFFKKRVNKVIGKGQLILQLVNEKEEIIKEYFLDEDKDLSINYISPGTYWLKVIFDRNNNGKWDTGNYLKYIQPEKVLYYPKSFEMVEGWEMNLSWDISKSLIKSMQNGDISVKKEKKKK